MIYKLTHSLLEYLDEIIPSGNDWLVQELMYSNK